MTPLKGRLLVASPLLTDPNFHRTVVVILEHGDEGALGVVLNRPTEVEVDRPLVEWRSLAADPRVIFVGGPVSRGSVIALAQVDGPGPGSGWQAVAGGLGVLDLTADADAVAPEVEGVRIFTGYAGWAGGQLEGEIDEGAWFVVDARPGDAFTPVPNRLWRDVLQRQPPPLSRFALYPPDPSVN